MNKPAAARVRRRPSGPDLFAGLALGLSAFGLYGATLCRTVYWYDSAEYVSAAHALGVPHPPGYPLYTLLAHAATWLPGPPALGVNALSAVAGALAVVVSYALGRRLGADPLSAAGGAALLGSGSSFWLNSTVAEVYAPGLCVSMSVLMLALRAAIERRPRAAVVAAALGGAGMGIHYSVATLGVGLALLVSQVPPAEPRRTRARRVLVLALACTLAAVVAYACVFAFVVLRADSEVVPNSAHPFSLARLSWLLLGGNYRLWFEALGMGAGSLRLARLLASELGMAGLITGGLGLVSLLRMNTLQGLALLLAIAGNLAFFCRYRVADLEVFLLPSVALLSVCAGLAVGVATRVAAGRFARAGRAPAVALLLYAGVRIVSAYPERDLSGFSDAEAYGRRLVAQLPYRAVILNYTTPEEWKYDAVFGMYFQHVLGERPDVVVVAHADRPVLDRLLFEGRPTYLYAPVAHVLKEYAAEQSGDLYRLLRRR